MPAVRAADGTRIVYDTFGRSDGEPLVLIMGLAIDRWGWVRQRTVLGAKFRCISIDNRGAGLSDKPHGNYDIFTMASDVEAVMDAEGIESMAEWSQLIEASGVQAFAQENLRWVAAARHMRWLTPLAPAFAPLLVRAPGHGVQGQIHAIASITEQLHDELRGIEVDTLVLVGSQDILTPVADSEEIAHLIPGARLQVISGAAHGAVVTDAGVFNRAVSQFLDETARVPA